MVEFVGERLNQPGRGPHVVVRMVGEGVAHPGASGVGGFGEQLATGGRELDEADARRSAGSRRRTTSPRASNSPTCLLTTDWQTPRRAASSPEAQLTLAEEQCQFEVGKRACDGVPQGVPVGPDGGDDGVADRVRRDVPLGN